MQCRLQIGHTGLDVVDNSGDQLFMPGKEVVPGLSLEEPLPAHEATVMLSSVCAHTGGGQKGYPSKRMTTNPEMVQFGEKTFVPYPVKGF